jgi:SPP1 family predicted phage head-tail adaptor
MPDPGELRKRFAIESEVRTDMGGGGSALSWRRIAQGPSEVWGKMTPARGGEQLQAMALEANTIFYIEIRWHRYVTEQHRLRDMSNGDIFNIRNAVDPDGRKQWTRIMAERGVAT